MFNVYINDLEEFLQANDCCGADVMGRPLSSLLFANDVMLLTYTAADLQYLLNRLKIYSLQWGLVVNTD